jgi:osmotically inducible protein OsmC
VLNKQNYTYRSRFEQDPGTNPEELVAAAHAGCFSMKLAFVLNAAGFTADQIETRCDVVLGKEKITSSHLTVNAKVPGIDKQKFDECAEDAKKNCPISRSLDTEITMEATLT